MEIISIVFKTLLKNLHLFGAAYARIRYSNVNHDTHKASMINKGNGSRHSSCSEKSRRVSTLLVAICSRPVIFGVQPIPKNDFRLNY